MNSLSSVMRNRRFALALSVHFKQKDLGMKKFEILSRGTAFFLSVDPPDPITSEESSGQGSNDNNYKHLKGRKRRMQNLENKTDAIDRGFLKTRAKGLKNRELKDLGWLEFCPVEYRPAVHVVAAAHVLSPFRYLDTYYSEQKSWLQTVKQENCAYSLDVFDMSSQNVESIAKFALNPYPIHHPEMDLGLIHLKDETQALQQLESLGIESLRLRDSEKNPYHPNEKMFFQGFEVATPDGTDKGNVLADNCDFLDDDEFPDEKEKEVEEDSRIFLPYSIEGSLIYASQERLLAKTETPLPDGLCGGPTIDKNGMIAGVVEGIVPLSHEDIRVAGAAAFIPSGIVQSFVDMAEMRILEAIVPEELFMRVQKFKSGSEENQREIPVKDSSQGSKSAEVELDHEIAQIFNKLKETLPPEKVEEIKNQSQIESSQAIEMLQRGDVDDIMEALKRVREQNEEVGYSTYDVDGDERLTTVRESFGDEENKEPLPSTHIPKQKQKLDQCNNIGVVPSFKE